MCGQQTEFIGKPGIRRPAGRRRAVPVCEMECDAIAAPAQFRNRSISRSFYSSDNLENIMDIENPLTFAQGLRYNGQVKEQC